MKFVLVFFFLSFYSLCFSQKPVLNANIEFDSYGNIFIENNLKKINKKRDTLISGQTVSLNKSEADLLGAVKLNYLYYPQYRIKKKKLNYVIKSEVNKNNSYLKGHDFILYTNNYLAYKKADGLKKKKFNLNIKLPSRYKLVYPLEEDLKQRFYYAPPIVAGKFINTSVRGFEVYSLKSHKNLFSKIDSIIKVIDNAYSFYLKKYPKRHQKPKIIFIPFKGNILLGKTYSNVIFLNSKMLSREAELETRLLAHEVAHLWWGIGGVAFNDRPITETIAEYMSTEYLKETKGSKYVKSFLNKKHYHCEGLCDKSEILKSKSSELELLYSYEFGPLILEAIQSNNSKLFDYISSFYCSNLSKPYVTVSELDEFFKEKKISAFIDNNKLPDYFFTETNDSLFIHGITDISEKVNIEFLDSNNIKKIEAFEFSKSKKIYPIEKKSFKKITIDPNYKIFQFTRLNDIWTNKDSSLLNKSRYFNDKEYNDTVFNYVTDVLNYIQGDSSNLFFNSICESNIKFKNKLNELKKTINIDGIISTGASSYYRVSKNEIDVKFSYYNTKEQKSNMLFFKLYLEGGIKYLTYLNYTSPKVR